MPTPPPCPASTVRARSGSMPTPSSETRSSTSASMSRPMISIRPRPRRSTPWRTAFSTSGCSDSTGTTAWQHLGRDLEPHLQAVAEAGPLEPQVLLDVVELVGERHVRALAAERVARELGELGQQLARLLGIGVDVAGDRRERVVDEVRRDLGPQRAQLGPREPLGLLLELAQLELRADEARRLGDRARVVGRHAVPARVERDERADELARRRPAARRPPAPSGQSGCSHSIWDSTCRRSSRAGAVDPEQRVTGVVVIVTDPVEREHRSAVAERHRRRLRQRAQMRQHTLGATRPRARGAGPGASPWRRAAPSASRGPRWRSRAGGRSSRIAANSEAAIAQPTTTPRKTSTLDCEAYRRLEPHVRLPQAYAVRRAQSRRSSHPRQPSGDSSRIAPPCTTNVTTVTYSFSQERSEVGHNQ